MVTEEKKGLFYDNNERITDISDFIYFSSTVYYSGTTGDILPKGNARWFMVAEMVASTVIHVLVLSFAISGSENKN